MTRAAELLQRRESEWRPQLRAVSLAAEIEVPAEEIRDVLRALGQEYRTLWDGTHDKLLTRRYPASLVMAMTGTGAHRYEHGNYWPELWDGAGVVATQPDQTVWADAFRCNLDVFRLARFRGLPLANVGEILMHAGIPDYCLQDLFTLLLDHRRREPHAGAADIIAWATSPGRHSRMNKVDTPVRHFITHGGEYVEDFVDRCIELLTRLEQPTFDLEGLQLPDRVVRRAVALAEDGVLDLMTRRRRATDDGLQESAHLLLEPFGRGLTVWLPPVPNAPQGRVRWQLVADGEAQTVTVASPWPAEVDTAPATAVPLSRSVREVTVGLIDSNRTVVIPVVETADPLMIFTEDGRQVPARAALAADRVWLLYPSKLEGTSVEPVVTGSLEDLEEVPAPYGWDGWRLRFVDLRKVQDLRLGEGARRVVRGGRTAQLQLAPPMRGVCTVYGSPVLDRAPMLILQSDDGVTTEWSVRIRRTGATAALCVESFRVDRETAVDPWLGVPRPLLGSYDITVRGPLGRGLSRRIEFAEGLRVESSPRWREISAAGLSPTQVQVSIDDDSLSVAPATARLGPPDAYTQLSVSGPDHRVALTFTPPHMAVQLTGVGDRSEWSLQPLRLETESAGAGQLLVRLPAAMPSELVVRVHDREVQTVPPVRVSDHSVARFELTAIADTVRSYGSVDLDVRLEGTLFPVARCTPRRLATGVVLGDDGRLALLDGTWVTGLQAGVYQVLAPWREPVVVDVDRDLRSLPLPADLRDGGPLAVLLRVDDPWLPVEWPSWPEQAFTAEGRPWRPEGRDAVETAVSGHFAGLAPVPRMAEAARLVVRQYSRAEQLQRWGVAVDVRAAVAEVLAADPAATLAALLEAAVPPQEVVAPLVQSGLVALPRSRYLDEEQESRLWGLSPVAGMLASAHRLTADSTDVDLRERIVATCGDVAENLLMKGEDPYSAVGYFDGTADRLATMKPAERDEFWQAVRIVPGGLLDCDERTSAAGRLLEVHTRPGIARVAARSTALLQMLGAAFDARGGTVVGAAVRARLPRSGWQGLPAVSIACAFAVRLSARGETPFVRLLPGILPHYAALARHAPQLIAIDLVRAELLLVGAEKT